MAACGVGAIAAACSDGATGGSATTPDAAAAQMAATAERDAAVGRLRGYEQRRRARTDFAAQPTSDELLGDDPYAAVAITPTLAVGILRARAAVVVLDDHGHELQRLGAPRWASHISRAGEDTVWLSSEGPPQLRQYRFVGERLQATADVQLTALPALRSLASDGHGGMYLADDASAAIYHLPNVGADTPGDRSAELKRVAVCHGPRQLRATGSWLIASCLYDHQLLLFPLADDGRHGVPKRIQHDGPIVAFTTASASSDGVLLAVAGVEDRPLDRSGGFFGHIDSFAWIYRVAADGRVERLAEYNLSDDGVINPKAMRWLPQPAVEPAQPTRLLVTGYGGERAVVLTWDDATLRRQQRFSLPPGSNDIALVGGRLLLANPLLDAWLSAPLKGLPSLADAASTIATASPQASLRPDVEAEEARLGEALLFTHLMAPRNRSDGALSRFSCETCHYEAYGDGRTHHTGRGEVRASTKTLRGLFNNKPHFSRALDPDLTQIAHAEFRVAGKGQDHEPWFELQFSDHPWLKTLLPQAAAQAQTLSPERLRKALIRYLMLQSHRPNPWVAQRLADPATTRFTPQEQRGAVIFERRCSRCHSPRLSSDDEASAVPAADWERRIFAANTPLVWGSDGYRKTGIVPYVHKLGARTPSLRRLHTKHPYFTNGSATSLDAVLAAAAWNDERFFHAQAPSEAVRLGPAKQAAVLSFLQLL